MFGSFDQKSHWLSHYPNCKVIHMIIITIITIIISSFKNKLNHKRDSNIRLKLQTKNVSRPLSQNLSLLFLSINLFPSKFLNWILLLLLHLPPKRLLMPRRIMICWPSCVCYQFLNQLIAPQLVVQLVEQSLRLAQAKVVLYYVI